MIGYSMKHTRKITPLLALFCFLFCSALVSANGDGDKEMKEAATHQPLLAKQTKTLQITEVMSSNDGILRSSKAKSSDWIEIQNTGSEAIDMRGYTITDDREFPGKAVFPAGLVLPPGECMILWADGQPDQEDVKNDQINKIQSFRRGLYAPFKISSSGESLYLFHPDGSLIQSLTIPSMKEDQSFGLTQQGTYRVLGTPTPGTPDYQYALVDTEKVAKPSFSQSPGFYEESFNLELSHPDPEAVIFYTLDGSEPDFNSNLYSEPIEVRNRSSEPDRLSRYRNTSRNYRAPMEPGFKGRTVRAFAWRPGQPKSSDIWGSWFVSPEGGDRYSLPVLSIQTDEEDLFDYEKGIYVLGQVFEQWRAENPDVQVEGDDPANYNQRGKEWSIPFRMDYFEQGQQKFTQNGRMRGLGGWSREHPVKSLRLDFSSPILYPLYPDLDIQDFHSLVLRTSANDWYSTIFRDAYMTHLADPWVEVQASRPVILFLNGEYWGIHNMRERVTEDYISSHFQIPRKDVSILEQYGELAEGDKKGVENYEKVLEFIRNQDLSIAENYQEISSMIDVDNYIHYISCQVFFANSDWPGNNIRFWQNAEENSPWRWILYDTDFGFGLYEWSGRYYHDTFYLLLDTQGPEWPNPPESNELFRALWNNPDFKRQFLTTYCDMLNGPFRKEELHRKLDQFQELYMPEMAEHIIRWRVARGSVDGWLEEIAIMRDFIDNRHYINLNHIARHSKLSGVSQVSLTADSGGQIRFNSLPPIEGEWKGLYIQGLEARLVAEPHEGYQFVRWEGVDEGQNPEMELLLEQKSAIRAVFEKE